MSTEEKSLEQYLQEQKKSEQEILYILASYKEQRHDFIKDILRKKGIIRRNLICLALVSIYFVQPDLEATVEELKEHRQQKRAFLTDIRIESNLVLKYTQNLFTLADEIIYCKSILEEIRNEIKGLESLIRGGSYSIQVQGNYALQVVPSREKTEQAPDRLRSIEYVVYKEKDIIADNSIKSVVQKVLEMAHVAEVQTLAENDELSEDEIGRDSDDVLMRKSERLIENADLPADEENLNTDNFSEKLENSDKNESLAQREVLLEDKAHLDPEKGQIKVENLEKDEKMVENERVTGDERNLCADEHLSKVKIPHQEETGLAADNLPKMGHSAYSPSEKSSLIPHQNLVRVSLKERQRMKGENRTKQGPSSTPSKEKVSSKSKDKKLWELSEMCQTFHNGLSNVFPFWFTVLDQSSIKHRRTKGLEPSQHQPRFH